MSVETVTTRPVPRADSWVARQTGDTAWILGAYVVAGLVGGVLWAVLADPAAYTVVHGRAAMGETQLGRQFGPDAVYALIGLVVSVLLALTLTVLRHRDALVVLVLLLVGSCLAATVMLWTGHLLGPGDPDQALKGARNGARVPLQLTVDSLGVYAVWPLGAMLGHLVDFWLGLAERRRSRDAAEST